METETNECNHVTTKATYLLENVCYCGSCHAAVDQ